MERFSRRQFITGGAVAALGGTLALAGCAPSGSSDAKGSSNGSGAGSSAGVGSGMGKHGQFDVEVMVTDGNLDRITQAAGAPAFDEEKRRDLAEGIAFMRAVVRSIDGAVHGWAEGAA